VIALGVALGVADALPARSVGTMVLLLLALGYFTAGLHLDRFFLWVGALLAAGSVVVMVGSPFAWSGVGIVLAVSLVVAGIREGRSREAIA
jgi:hypothetical protein